MICRTCNLEFDSAACPRCGGAATSAVDDRVAAASALLQEGLADQAIEALEQALSSSPRSYQVHHLLGEAYLRQGEFALAGHHFERAVWLDSGCAAARYNLARAYRSAGRMEDALQQVRAALSKDPAHAASKSLLKELELAATRELSEPPPGAAENRPRAAAPHLAAVHVRGRRLSRPVQTALGALAAILVIILGSFAYAATFRLLTSPQLLERDAVLWRQLPYATAGIAFVAGVIAASFQIPGLPFAGALAGLIAIPAAVAIPLMAEHEPVMTDFLVGAAAYGALGVAVTEALAKFTPLGEWRRALVWVSVAAAIVYVVAGYSRLGTLEGSVLQPVPGASDLSTTMPVPGAEITLQDPRSGLAYATTATGTFSGERHELDPSVEGRYRLRGMPVGYCLLTVRDPRTGATWRDQVFVDYAITSGNSYDVVLVPSAEEIAVPAPAAPASSD
jgi:hypothetical protein